MQEFHNIGITPAGAGKTYYELYNSQRLQDHPRRCGENDDIQPEFPNVVGSPPQVRGKHTDSLHLLGNDRITPAGAGKTYSFRFLLFRY